MPEYREIKTDFRTGLPIYRGGAPVTVTGAEAVLTWAYNALRTVRGRFPALSSDYGSDMEKMLGAAYTEDVKRSEAPRYIRECLLINPYIDSVDDLKADFSGASLSITCRLKTKYGEVTMDGILV